MPSTHLSLHYHLIFSTKNPLPQISKDWRIDLHAYLGGIVKGINGVLLAIGGIEDHAHLLVGLRATHRLDYVLRDIKTDSSGWVHKTVGSKKIRMAVGLPCSDCQSFSDRTSSEVHPQPGETSSSKDFSRGVFGAIAIEWH